jgi:hypothetical protein
VGVFPAAIPVRRRFGAAKNSGGSGCFFASFAVVLVRKTPEIVAALSPGTGSSCRATQSKTSRRYHRYSVFVNSQYVDYCARARINHPRKAGMSQPTMPFPQGTITKIRPEDCVMQGMRSPGRA